MPAIAEAQVLIMATDGFEESELFGPREILLERGRQGEAGVADADADPGDGARRPGQGDPARPDDRRGRGRGF